MEQIDGLRRDGAWEHDVLQQRAGEAPLEEAAAHACVLMHVGAAQARTPMRQERSLRQGVSRAVQVRVVCRRRRMCAVLPNLVSVRIPEEDARREYM